MCPNGPKPDNNSERLEKLRAAVDGGAIFTMKTDQLKLALGVLGFTALSGKAKAQLQTLFQQALRNGPAEPKSAKKKKLQKPGAPEVDVLTPTSVCVKWTPATGCDAIKYTVGITEHDVRHTVAILRDYGNLGSGSFLFSYQRLLNEGTVRRGDYGVMMTMGPGSTVETALIRW